MHYFYRCFSFRQYLIHGQIPEKYLKKIEEAVISVVLLLKNQIHKSKYDDLLISCLKHQFAIVNFQK
jgi:hypothetical protein